MGSAVLIVEDEPGVRALLHRYLQRAGYEVECAASAEEAMQWLERKCRFDVFLVDLTLPGMSGSELARHILAEVPQAGILLTSGHAFDPDGGELAHQRVAFLRKPFPPSELVGALHRLAHRTTGSTAS
jgi:CheY-like chemotaxis protein